MEKYNGLKTIGDGTYGSVVKAMNMKTGKLWICLLICDIIFSILWSSDLLSFLRGNRCDQENEEKVCQVGLMYKLAWDTIFDEAASSQYCSIVWGHIRKKCFAFRIRVPWYECLSAYERKEETFFRTSNKKYNVSNDAGLSVYA